MAPILVPRRIGVLAEPLDGAHAAKPDVLVPISRARPAAPLEGRTGLTARAIVPEVRPSASSATLASCGGLALAWQEARPEVLTPRGEDAVRVDVGAHEAIPEPAVGPRVEPVPGVPRAPVLQGLREVIPFGTTSSRTARINAQVTRLPMVVATMGDAGPAGLIRTQVQEGPRALSAPLTRLQLPTGSFRKAPISLRAPSPRLEVPSSPTPLAGLAIAAIPA